MRTCSKVSIAFTPRKNQLMTERLGLLHLMLLFQGGAFQVKYAFGAHTRRVNNCDMQIIYIFYTYRHTHTEWTLINYSTIILRKNDVKSKFKNYLSIGVVGWEVLWRLSSYTCPSSQRESARFKAVLFIMAVSQMDLFNFNWNRRLSLSLPLEWGCLPLEPAVSTVGSGVVQRLLLWQNIQGGQLLSGFRAHWGTWESSLRAGRKGRTGESLWFHGTLCWVLDFVMKVCTLELAKNSK